jgi:hypothetical protein
MKNELQLQFKGDYPAGSAIVKIWSGKKYIVWKFKELLTGSELFKTQMLDKIIKERLGTLKKDDIFYKLAEHMSKTRSTKITIEVLFRSERPEELLLKETYYLNQSNGDANCLNVNKDPYLPAWMRDVSTPTTKISDSFFFRLKGRHRAASAIVKLHAGDKYMVWKFKSVNAGAIQINKSFNTKLRNGVNEFDLFKKLLKYVIKNNINEGTIEIIHKSNDYAELLNVETELLKGRDPNRLNTNKKPYIPEWMSSFKKLKAKTF